MSNGLPGAGPAIPIRETFPDCVSAASGARARLTARPTVSPIRRMLPGSLAEGVQRDQRPGPGPHRGAGQHALFDHLICLEEDRLRDREAEGLGGLEVDD